MSASVFISYSRRNGYFAERLYLDLKRAGVDAWLDQADIPADRRWRPEVQDAIQQRRHFLLLASPESARSEEVARELVEAERAEKSILRLRVGGELPQLPATWRECQIIDSDRGYWGRLARLLPALGVTSGLPRSLDELVQRRQGTVADAASELTGAELVTVAGRDYWKLPVEPSGYTMTWLVAPADAALEPPPSLALLLRFAGRADRDTLGDVLEFLGAGDSVGAWLVYVLGPKNRSEKYELPVAFPHYWEDADRGVYRAMHLSFVKKELRVFLDCPATLAYRVAGLSRETERHHLYQFDQDSTGQVRYWRVLGPKGG